MRELGEKFKLSRRCVLISAAGVLAGVTNWVQAAGKVPQSVVYYQPSPKDGHDCQHCLQFAAPNACKLVDGDIVPNGWCRLWTKKAG